MTEVSIRLAELQDAPAILQLQKLAYESEARLYNDWSIPPLTQTLASLEGEFQTHTVLKAALGEQLVGTVRTITEHAVCSIGRLAVLPEFQGQGIGSKLLRAAENEAKDTGKFELFTGAKSEANIRLYQRHGYNVVRTEVLSPAVSLVFMEKRVHDTL
ncbi:GNAT family N-acetyltransferase [Desulfobulbus rhabdoformis]|uniref:GNAT family N-acetyltransferase n=1 Tax=Desulfobulbus rhabdoformis TaxID=34032 RepID=UPI0019647BFE|nr:GNAT family N-acetyltransferase [Desulfobulbus rhabdoformis]MBM9616078.1 GNAT family N-acetyltransferase [Desulfobulbus rhabdoformis]